MGAHPAGFSTCQITAHMVPTAELSNSGGNFASNFTNAKGERMSTTPAFVSDSGELRCTLTDGTLQVVPVVVEDYADQVTFNTKDPSSLTTCVRTASVGQTVPKTSYRFVISTTATRVLLAAQNLTMARQCHSPKNLVSSMNTASLKTAKNTRATIESASQVNRLFLRMPLSVHADKGIKYGNA